mgnify:CR=1 FL=1
MRLLLMLVLLGLELAALWWLAGWLGLLPGLLVWLLLLR